VLRDARAVAEEGDLHPELGAVLRLEPAGDVPPFVAELRMAAAVAGKLQRHALLHRRIVSGRPGRGRQRRAQREPGLHQSSLTARTASPLIAWRPLAIAVSVASASIAATSSASRRQGMCRSMPQWKDWGFTTSMSTRLMSQPSARPTARPTALTSRPSPASM